MTFIAIVVLSYLIGAIPFGYIAGKLSRGIDIRHYGSGATGATNTLRTLGIIPSILVLIGDAAKGAAVVLLARYLFDNQLYEVAAAIAAIVGHNWPVYIGFKGGKGVNTSVGAFLVISPWVALLSTAIGLAVIGLSRYVSLGSMLGAVLGFLFMVPLYLGGREPAEHLAYALVMASLVLLQHRENISRLLVGAEKRLGEKAGRKA